MTLALWPESLPLAPLADRYQETLADTLVRSKVDQGPDKVRRRTTAGVAEMSVSYVLDADQSAVIADFYTTTLAGGSLPFVFQHPRSGAVITVRLKRPPQLSARNGSHYLARLELEVLP